VGYGVTLTAIGLTIGLITAIAASPLLRNVPITVRSPDAGTVAPVALLIGAIALVASALPARRAASVDLMSMLRKE
jgi:ABC-type antimicrobial peptide transport system permease subunit